MPAEIRLRQAQLGDELEADVVGWLVPDGSQVEAGQPLLEVSTAKVIVQLESPGRGRLRQRVVAGQLVALDAVLGEIEDA